MAEYIELTEELILSMRAGARAIANTKRYHGTIFVSDVFSENPKQIPYLQAAEILCAASENDPSDVAPVRHGRWIERKSLHAEGGIIAKCSACQKDVQYLGNPLKFCPHCGAKMDLED